MKFESGGVVDKIKGLDRRGDLNEFRIKIKVKRKYCLANKC